MGNRGESRPESEKTECVMYGMPWESGIMANQSLKKDRVCTVWYAMGIRNFGRPESEKDSV